MAHTVPLTDSEIEELGAQELAELGYLTRDCVVERIRGRDNTKLLARTQVTSRRSLVETMKMKLLKTKLPQYKIGFWEFAFEKTFVTFAKDVDYANSHIISQETMQVCWNQTLTRLFRQWKSPKLSDRKKTRKLACARLQANSNANEKTKRYWEKKAKRVWKTHGVKLELNNGYDLEGFSNLSAVNSKGESYEVTDEDALFGFVDLMEHDPTQAEIDEQRQLLGDPEIHMNRAVEIATSELAKATQKFENMELSMRNNDPKALDDSADSPSTDEDKTDSDHDGTPGDENIDEEIDEDDSVNEFVDSLGDIAEMDFEQFDEEPEEHHDYSDIEMSDDEQIGISSRHPTGREHEDHGHDSVESGAIEELGSEAGAADSDNETYEGDEEEDLHTRNKTVLPTKSLAHRKLLATKARKAVTNSLTGAVEQNHTQSQGTKHVRVPARSVPDIEGTNFRMWTPKRKRGAEDIREEDVQQKKKRDT